MELRKIERCSEEETYFARLERLYDYVSKSEPAKRQQLMEDIVYEFLGLLYFSMMRGYEFTVTEKAIEFCLSAQLTGSHLAIAFYINSHKMCNGWGVNYESEKAQFVYDLKNCIRTVLHKHTLRNSTDLIKTKKISENAWILTGYASVLKGNGYECPALFKTVLCE
jgi:hypothetical protein